MNIDPDVVRLAVLELESLNGDPRAINALKRALEPKEYCQHEVEAREYCRGCDLLEKYADWRGEDV